MASESQEQQALIQWSQYARQEYKELELLYHVPNGGRRDKREALSFKRQGVKAGVPDLVLPVGRGGYLGLYVELKVGKNKTTANQNIWIENLRNQNYRVQVCYGWLEAKKVIEDYLMQPKTEVIKK